MQYRAVISMRLPSLNEYINACRSNCYQAAWMKRKYETEIGYFLLHLPKIRRPVTIHFHWVEPNRKRDLDNVAFAKKFILDAMVKKRVLENDNSKHVTGFTDTFELGDEAKVIITVSEVEE